MFLDKHRILVVDDEQEIAELVRDYLQKEGYEVVLALDGEEAIKLYRETKPSLAVLDIMLPGVEGTEVCRIIRSESSIPVIMLSAKSGDIDKILSLGLGADDYMTKPFSPMELVARVKAQLRRYTTLSAPAKAKDENIFIFHDLKVDIKGYDVFIRDRKIELSAKEFEVLHLFCLHPGQVLTREQIFDQVWGFNEYGDINTVTVHIRKIREKIEQDPSKPVYIKTVWGVGYKFDGGS